MGASTNSNSSASASASTQSSGDYCQREEKGMDKVEHFNLHHPPPPCPIQSRGKKHHRHRHHSYRSPPLSPSHHRHQFFEHPSMDGPYRHNLPPPLGCPHHRHHKEGMLRVKSPKHLKKVLKLNRKLMKAYKPPKSARHGAHHHHRMHFPPPTKGFFNIHFGHQHSPGCFLHSMEEPTGLHEISILHHYHPRHHGRHPHPCCPRRSLIKSEVVGGEVAVVSPRGVEVSAEPPIEGGVMPLASDMPPADEPVPVILAP